MDFHWRESQMKVVMCNVYQAASDITVLLWLCAVLRPVLDIKLQVGEKIANLECICLAKLQRMWSQ